MTPAPVRVGVLNDGEHRSPASGGPPYHQLERDMRVAIDGVARQGRLDRPIEFVHADAHGLPGGTAFAVEQAFAQLSDEGALLIVGPAIGDNAIAATPLADRLRMPAINWSASERARSEYMFHLQVGSHEDESIIIARHLAERGLARVGVVYDRSAIGRRHVSFFEHECEVVGVTVAARLPIAPLATSAAREVTVLRDEDVGALVYLGLGWAGREVARARSKVGWSVPAIMNAAGMRGADPEFARDIDGWVYPDMHSDGNSVLRRVQQELGEAPRRHGASLALGYDMGQLVAEAVARAPELTRDGIRQGLELTKRLAAAQGFDGTTLGFGRWDRGALKGQFLVLRQWREGRSVEL